MLIILTFFCGTLTGYVYGYLRGLVKGLEAERPEPILEQLEAFKKPFDVHKFAIIPSRREKIEIEKEEAENWKPGNVEEFLK